VTSGRRLTPFAARTLPIALARRRFEPITTAANTRQLPITHDAARGTAHPLGLDRRRRNLEHLPALGASTPHGQSVRRPPSLAAGGSRSRRRARTDPRRDGSRSRREVDPS